jgi:hypothetical protein
MDPNLIPNTLAISLFLASLFISLRAFYVYVQDRSPRLFVLALAMAVIALTAADNFIVNVITVPYNTYWFLYIGQAASYLFIWLSFFRNSRTYLQKLMFWQVLASALLIGLLILSPVIPPFTNATTGIRAILSGSRSVFCFGIFYCYTFAFMAKQTRFGFFMSLAFMLLAIGQWLVVMKYFVANSQLLDSTGDITRLVGLIFLLAAVLLGR